MRLVLIVVLGIFSCVSTKTNTKALTESMGQEVIEIGAPMKVAPAGEYIGAIMAHSWAWVSPQTGETRRVLRHAAPVCVGGDLPPDLEEEPAAELDEADKPTSTTVQPATPRDARKFTTMETRRRLKDIDKMDNVKQEDDEARIEKELAEMYKDTDYKADSAEVTQEDKGTSTANITEKPIGRMRENFKFQPDRNNPREVEKFRTSVDDISCTKYKLVSVSKQPNSGYVATISRTIVWGMIVLIL